MYTPGTILSENSKCGHSLDLPIKGHCTPTKNCAHDCYARCGRQSFPASKKKHDFVSQYLKGNDISRLISECKPLPAVRLNGSGDLLPEHIPQIISLAKACPNTQFWGMTRKINIATQVNNQLPNLKLLVSVDASSPKSVWNYPGKLCWGPKRPNDQVPQDPRIHVIFPRHSSGRVVKGVTKDPNKDCLAVWHDIKGCHQCGKCWSW
jgi:hypothetical protein